MFQNIKQWCMHVYSQQFQLYLCFIIMLSFVVGGFFAQQFDGTRALNWRMIVVQMKPKTHQVSLHCHMSAVSQLFLPSASFHSWVLDLPSKESISANHPKLLANCSCLDTVPHLTGIGAIFSIEISISNIIANSTLLIFYTLCICIFFNRKKYKRLFKNVSVCFLLFHLK